jgi:N-acyl-L-homoserine lactone synthetase
MHNDVITWAKAQGCSALSMSGRFGWKKPLKAHGWEVQHASYVKEFA